MTTNFKCANSQYDSRFVCEKQGEDCKTERKIVHNECKRCLFTSDIAIIPAGGGQCNYCDIHDQLEAQSKGGDLEKVLAKIRRPQKQYDCIMGISGGNDSSTLLYAAVKHWGLKPLVIHFDNGWNNEVAESNMKNLVAALNVNCIIYKVDAKEYRALNDSFLAAGLPDADIPNDIAMTKLMYETAHKYGIKYILNGHDFRTEGSTPAKWTYMDAKYIQSVYQWHTGKRLKNYPLFTFWDQIFYALKGIKNIRPFHYGFDRAKIEAEMIRDCGWKSYGPKHCENIYTEFVGAYLLPKKFKIDKRIVYLSAHVRSGTMTKLEAMNKMMEKTDFNTTKLGHVEKEILKLADYPKQSRSLFARYNFRKWKLLIWVLAKMKVVPHTFYVKYAK